MSGQSHLQLLASYGIEADTSGNLGISLNDVVIDSDLTDKEALGDTIVPEAGQLIHTKMKPHLHVIRVVYWGFDGRIHIGQLVGFRKLVETFEKLFHNLFLLRFPLSTVIPQSQFGYDDERSMAANNSSCYRPEPGSEHRWGGALDLNPMLNPFDTTVAKPETTIQPAGACYDPSRPGTIVQDGLVREMCTLLDLEWGGNWGNPQATPFRDFYKTGFFDYQHFQPHDAWLKQLLALLPPGV